MEIPLKIAICEDKNSDAALLMDYIKQSGIHSVCQVFSCGEDFLNSFTPGHYDVIFMDIYMEGMHGIDTSAKIREVDENVILAFTTTSTDYTLESYRLDALKYLEKPVTLKEVQKTLELASIKRNSTEYLSLLINGKNEKIIMDSIIYFENQNHTVIVNTVTGILRTSQKVTISHIESMLPNPPFLRCHHSYIANLQYVQKLDKELKIFIMKNGGNVYIRRSDMKKASKAYEDYLFRAARGGRK